MKRAGKITVAMACIAAFAGRASSEQATGQEPVVKEGEALVRVPSEPPPDPVVEDDDALKGKDRKDPKVRAIDFRGRRASTSELDEVHKHVYERGSARVIMGLPVHFVPEGLLKGREVSEQRKTIARAQERVLAHFAHGVEKVVHRFETIPYVVVKLNKHGADNLRDAEIASAILDRENAPSLASTTAIIGATTAGNRGITGTGQTVAILDTGVDSNHPFLAGSVVDEACFGSCPNGGSMQFGPGAGAPLPAVISGAGHGTHVAGIAAGRATPNVGFRGTARGASVMAINVFHRVDNFWPFNFCGSNPSPCARAWTSDIIAGLERVFNQRGLFSIAAVNMSLGGGGFTSECSGSAYDTIVSNLRSAGIATIVAAGNDGFANALSEPACVPGVISVGATDNNDVVPQFSNSASFLDFLAPGDPVLSSVPGGGFAFMSGTSMAAPHVAGTFALLKQRYPNASVFALERALAQTARRVLDFGSGITTPRIQAARAVASPAVFNHDFTRDRAADIAVWRPWTGEWWVLGQPTTVWGQSGDKPVAGDYDGDGTVERAIWRPSTGDWWIPGQSTVQWGAPTDVPVPADYDGNGTIDIAVWRPSTGEWFVRDQFVVQWGAPGDIPVPADYNNDGRADVAVWRPWTGEWFVRGQFVVVWGVPGDVPVAADYDGNGTADVAIWRPGTGDWWILGQPTVQWGQAGDIPIPRDIGNGRAELTVWRPSTGEWFTLLRLGLINISLPTTQWGTSGDVPL